MSPRAELVESYRLARHAQDLRAEAATHGYATELAEYFGPDGVEKRLTFKEWLIGSKAPVEDEPVGDAGPAVVPCVLVTADAAFWLSGAQLAELSAAGCVNAAGEVERRRVKRASKRLARAS